MFLYAGISKVADRRFLDGNSPTGIHARWSRSAGASPIGSLLGPVADHSFAFGLFMAIAEIAVGLGLAARAVHPDRRRSAAWSLSLSLWLTVSWGASPWFTSADIVYLFAFTPLLIAGAGGVSASTAGSAAAARRHPGVGEDRTRRVLLGGAAAVGVLVLLGIAALARSTRTPRPTARRRPGEPATGGAVRRPAARSRRPSWSPPSAVPVGSAASRSTTRKPAIRPGCCSSRPASSPPSTRSARTRAARSSFVSAERGLRLPVPRLALRRRRQAARRARPPAG